MANVIYHYTDMRGMLSIIQNRTVWLSHISYLNDSAEFKWFQDLFDDVLGDYRAEEAKKADDGITGKELCFIAGLSKRRLSTIPGFYVACLSRHGDLLNQWRAYAGNGLGFAIGFDEMHFKSFETPPTQCDPCYCVREVIYDPNIQRRLALSLVEESEGRLGGSSKDMAEKVIAERENVVGMAAAAIKNPAFEQECEVRLIFKSERGTLISGIEGPKYRATERFMVPYYELHFQAEAVREIVFGPKNDFAPNRWSVEGILRSAGYNLEDIDLRQSGVTYR